MSTITTIAGSDVVANSRATINTNFSNLNTDKVEGPSSSVDSEVALFNSTTGKIVKRASGSGIAKLTSGVLSVVTAPSGTIVGTSDTQDLTNKTLDTPVVKGWSGWQLYSAVTPTYTSADDPTYTITFAAVDLTSLLSVGMKVKFTNNSTTFYGFITAIAFSTNTVVTLYGGTDYDVANSAITNFYFSTDRAPHGFPLDPLKWTASATDTSMRTQATPTQNTWYNPGSITLSVPIGSWKLSFLANVDIDDASASTPQFRLTLSTANNSESDAAMTAAAHVVLNAGTRQGLAVYREKHVLLAAKTSHYLNIMTPTASVDNLNIRGDIGTTVISATCAYL